MRVMALAGGVGGAKLLVGLDRVVGTDLTAVVNTGDDATIYGVHVSPDVDIVTYWLAGIADVDRGWGIKDDTFTVVGALGELGTENWFRLGDRDFATCLLRTERLRSGQTLSSITAEITRGLGVRPLILPMSDDPVRTQIETDDESLLEFQEYFVKHRTEPIVKQVVFSGIEGAKPSPGLLDAIETADAVVVCPSNPIVSIGPILAISGIRDALRTHRRVIAVTPIIRGAALKGPADRMLASLGYDVSASGVAGLYADFCDTFVVDERDQIEAENVEDMGLIARVADTIMGDHDASERLARVILRL
jgi:LPPG:FO 2-phospho-L-lactate transferase